MAGYDHSSYDVVPYTGKAFTETHPDTLATIASLFGMNPPDVSRARVLEIGCAMGVNLIPIAAALPHASFLGIDLSERQVAEGRAAIAAAGLANIELTRLNILDAGPELGTFDYIICHGVFSWVPPDVQQQILALVAATLAPDGVAYVSYNTYPGWHVRGILRDAMLFHMGGEAAPLEGIRKAREALEFFAQFDSAQDTPYLAALRHYRADIVQRDDSYVLHEYLEDVNQALYYHEFLAVAKTARLKVVADARFDENACLTSGPLRAALDRVSDDPARREAYFDFLRGRSFRRTLLCHEGVELLSEPSIAPVERLQAALNVIPGSMFPEFPTGVVEGFTNWRNQTIMIDHPVIKAALLVLGDQYPRAVSFHDLWLETTARLSSAGLPAAECGDPERRRLAAFLFRGYAANWIELHSHLAPFVREASERPAATQLARNQARSGGLVVNLRHESIELKRFERQLLGLLDGQRTHNELLDALDALVTEGKLTIRGSDPGPLDAASRRTIVAESLRQGLARLGAVALLRE